MADRPVHWHEGMFLGPQHLQAAQRYEAVQRRKYARAATHYCWGLQSIELDPIALAASDLVIRSLKAFLRDGTLVDLPDDGVELKANLREHIEKHGLPLTVFLALPSFQMKRANASEEKVEGVRFLEERQQIEDENTGKDLQWVRFRILNAQLKFEETAGYDLLPIARIEKSPDADGRLRLDVGYIPSAVACEASPVLRIGILRNLYDRISLKIDLLAEQVESRGISILNQMGEDALIIGQLRALNEAYTVLRVIAFAEGVHPLDAYVELCRIAGQLTIFRGKKKPDAAPPASAGAARISPLRAPELPLYDHDDLGYCFFQVKKYIDLILGDVIEPKFQWRLFRGIGIRMQVELESVWLEPAWLMFVAVESLDGTLTPAECVRLFTTPGELDMKIGSSARVEQIFTYAQSGLAFAHQPNPPRALPVSAARTYFQVNRTAHPNEWERVRQTMSLAIRVNERIIKGSVDGAESLIILNRGREIPVRLALYVTQTQT